MELSTRFINAYNTIDSALKEQNDLKRSLSYTESIRKAAKTNAIVIRSIINNKQFLHVRNELLWLNLKDIYY